MELPVFGEIVSPPSVESVEEAITTYFAAGLQPILVHAPLEGGGCTCRRQACTSWGKHPILKAWQRRRDAYEVRDQLARSPFVPNVGLALGEQVEGEYIIAIDVDSEERVVELTLEIGPLPDTVTSTTGKGRHLLYELPADLPVDRKGLEKKNVKNLVGLKGKKGVDIRAGGGQIVAAPSVHRSWARYVWTRTGEIATLPMEWAIELVDVDLPKEAKPYTPQTFRSSGKVVQRFEKYLEGTVNKIGPLLASCGEGSRNRTLYKSAFRLFSICNRVGHGFDYVEKQMADAGRASGLSLSEVRRTIASARKGVINGDVYADIPDRKQTNGASAPAAEEIPPEEERTEPATQGAVDPLTKITLINDRGEPAKSAGNVAALLQQHPIWNGGPAWDTYSQMKIWPRPLPEPLHGIHRRDHELVDADHAAVQSWLYRLPASHRVRAGRDEVGAGLDLCCAMRPIDLLRLFVERLPEWDRIPRIDVWPIVYLGCEDTPYVRATGRAWLVACIERALAPGILIDVAPVLEGPQGSGKNRALATLFAGGPVFAPWLVNIAGHRLDRPETMRLACTRWIMHDDEFQARSPAKVDELKAWASRTQETYRLQYAREISVYPRRGLLVASINPDGPGYLHDSTGNRRWWPWRTGHIDISALDHAREQLFSEAREALLVGGSWRETLSASIYGDARAETERRRVRDPIVGQIADLLAGGGPKDVSGKPLPLTTHRIARAIGYPAERIDKLLEMRIGSAMRELGFAASKERNDGAYLRVYERPN